MSKTESNSSVINVEDEERIDIIDYDEKSGFISGDFSTDNIEDLVATNPLTTKSRESYIGDEDSLSSVSADSAKGSISDDPVKVYLREIGRIKLLSTDDEIRLAKEIM